MKTGKFLLTAFASLALSTAAYADEIKVSNWVPQTPAAGEAIYVNDLDTRGETSNTFVTYINREGASTTSFSEENNYTVDYMSLSYKGDVATAGPTIFSYKNGEQVGEQQLWTLMAIGNGKYKITWEGDTWKGNLRKVAFISVAQYEFHKAAQKAADLLNKSKEEYTGSTYDQLVAAIQTTGEDWANQTTAIATLQEQYLADKEAVEKALDELPEYIALGTLTTEVIKSSETLTLPEGAFMTVNDNDFKVDGSTINFVPSYVSDMNLHAQKYNAWLTVNVGGLERNIPVYGYNPMLSWNENSVYNYSYNLRFNEPGEQVKRFWAAGYQGLYEDPEFTVVYPENTPSQAIQAFDIKVTKIDEDGNFNLDNVKIAYEVKVTFKDDVEAGSYQIYGIKIMNNYGQYLTLNINASKTSIEITDEYGRSSVDGYGFSYKGGTAHLAVKYAGFEGANAGARLKIEADENSPFSAKFVKEQEYFDGLSYQLNGNGLIYLDVTCAPMSEEDLNEIVEGAIKIRLENSWGPQLETSDEITLTRSTKPVISYADDEEKHEITLGGEVFDTHIDFNADGFGSIYSKDNIKIFTDCDVFVVGKMISWNKDGNRATISLKYDPTHAGVEMKGILYIMYNDQKLTYDLTGLAVSQAKLDELHGISTGIENVEAEGAAKNGVMFNVAGQRVNGSAKGLVIKNGKKYIVK